MTSNIAGKEPPLPNSNRSFPLPPTRTASHDLQQTPRSWPRQTLNPTPNAPASSQGASEPASKRQKTGDPDIDLNGKTGGTIPNISDSSHATTNKGALLMHSACTLPDRASGDKEQQSSLLPIRPSTTIRAGGHQHGRALAIERAKARDVVPVKPYVPEPPAPAPRFRGAGKCPALFTKACILIHEPQGRQTSSRGQEVTQRMFLAS